MAATDNKPSKQTTQIWQPSQAAQEALHLEASKTAGRGAKRNARPNASSRLNDCLANLCGPMEDNLRQLAEGLEIDIARRDCRIRLLGEANAVAQAKSILDALFLLSQQPVHPEQIQWALISPDNRTPSSKTTAVRKPASQHHPQSPKLDHKPVDELDLQMLTPRGQLQARTERQQSYMQGILRHDLSFGIGPAGTGKTFLAVACALYCLEQDWVKRLVLTRPAVEAGERLGFLPGDLSQKVDPYLRPLYDALYELAGYDRVQKWFERNIIEIAPLAYMRGRTLNHAFVILDEAQNTTQEQMKMFLTRLGFGSRAVVTGDPSQIDLPRGQQSGLVQALQLLPKVTGIHMTHFERADVVRHPLVARIIEAYERHETRASKT